MFIFFWKSLLFGRTHLLFENSSTSKHSSTFRKLIYFKTLIYFSKTHLLFKNSSTSKHSSTFQKLIYLKNLIYFSRSHLVQKAHLLLKTQSKKGEEKRKQSFWTPISRSFFFGNGLKKNTWRSNEILETLPKKWLRETHVPYFNKKILKDEESFWQPQATDNGRGGKTKMQRGTSEFKMKWCGT